jgi:hypothetical protein
MDTGSTKRPTDGGTPFEAFERLATLLAQSFPASSSMQLAEPEPCLGVGEVFLLA